LSPPLDRALTYSEVISYYERYRSPLGEDRPYALEDFLTLVGKSYEWASQIHSALENARWRRLGRNKLLTKEEFPL
jgi:hypothetical protein